MTNLVNIETFEKQVEEIENITIVVRASSTTQVQSYNYSRKAADSSTIGDWIANRVRPKLGDLEIKVIDGELESPRRNSKLLENLRKSYK